MEAMGEFYQARISWLKSLACILCMGLIYSYFVASLLDDIGIVRVFPHHTGSRFLVGNIVCIGVCTPMVWQCLRLAICLLTGRPALEVEQRGFRNYVKGGFYAYGDIAKVEPAKGNVILVRLSTGQKTYMTVIWCVDPKWVIAKHLDDAVQVHNGLAVADSPTAAEGLA